MGKKGMARTPKKYDDMKPQLEWQWLTDIPWFKKMPIYQQNQLWRFVFNRLNDLCMILHHEDGIFPKVREQAYGIISARNNLPIGQCSPETIGTGLSYHKNQKLGDNDRFLVNGCSSVYWAPILLACYDNFHGGKGVFTDEWVPEAKNKKLEI